MIDLHVERPLMNLADQKKLDYYTVAMVVKYLTHLYGIDRKKFNYHVSQAYLPEPMICIDDEMFYSKKQVETILHRCEIRWGK